LKNKISYFYFLQNFLQVNNGLIGYIQVYKPLRGLSRSKVNFIDYFSFLTSSNDHDI